MVCALEDFMKSRFVLGAFAMTALVACGGDDGGGGGIKVPDGGGGSGSGQMDAPAAACAAQADYASPTPMGQGALRYCATETALVKCPTTATTGTMGTATDPLLVVYVAQLNAQNDFFSFEMWKGAEPFMMKIQPAANISLSDPAQSQWKTCAACAYVSAQVDLNSGMDMGTYLANSGTANVTTVTLVNDPMATKVAGSVSMLNMVHIDIAMDGMSTNSADGCSTKLSSLSYDVAIRDPMMMFTQDPVERQALRVAQRAWKKLQAELGY